MRAPLLPCLVCPQVPGDEPVWQQLLRDYSNYSDAELAQEVAAKLADVRLE
jgi:hypothetical protein